MGAHHRMCVYQCQHHSFNLSRWCKLACGHRRFAYLVYCAALVSLVQLRLLIAEAEMEVVQVFKTICLASLSIFAALLQSSFVHAQDNPPPAVTPSAVRSNTKPRPTAPAKEVTFLTDGPAETKPAPNFIQVKGLVFEDVDGNGKQDTGEPALKGVGIGAQVPEQTASLITALATTNDQGAFELNVPSNALITLLTPEGWRVAGPSTQFAAQQIVYALKPDRVIVERMMPAPQVKIETQASLFANPQDMAWAIGLISLLGLSLALLLVQAIGSNTKVMRQIVAWQFDQWNLHEIGQRVSRNKPMAGTAGDAIGYAMAEQVVADALNLPVQFEAFLGMSSLPKAWMKFATKEGQTFTFSLTRTRIPGCRWHEGHGISERTGQSNCLLRRVYQHFAERSNNPRMLPHGSRWYVFVEKPSVEPGTVRITRRITGPAK